MLTRRQFLGSTCAAAAAAGTASPFGEAQPQDFGGKPAYRALVCIALGGGADSYNMLVPTDGSAYRNYVRRRGDLSLNRDELLQLPRGDQRGQAYALHHGMREVHQLFADGEIALVANVGPLPGPGAQSDRFRQPDLSHIDQIAHWHHGSANRNSCSGWAGRVADLVADSGWQARVQTNISMSGRNVIQLGRCSAATNVQVSPYQQRLGSPIGVDFSYVNEQLAERVINGGPPWALQRRRKLLDKAENESRRMIEEAVADSPEFATPFAADSFSADLERVAWVIAARGKLGVRRQIFYVHFDGWDHHHRLLENQARMLPILSRGLAAFREALVELDVFDDVSTFTISEFGRSLESNGGGSDHGWGGHQIVMGGGVHGGSIYGQYPDLASGNPLDIGNGCFVPTTSMDEYLAELVLWHGTPAADLSYVLPDISRFWSTKSHTPPVGMLT